MTPRILHYIIEFQIGKTKFLIIFREMLDQELVEEKNQ